MAVPTSITDLDSTIANNSPAGSDAIGTTLDDYLRSHAGIIRATTNKNTTINRVQLGEDATATNNFTLTAEAADGTMKLARGNAGATSQDILTVAANGATATRGTNTNDSAAAGFVGEYVESTTLYSSAVTSSVVGTPIQMTLQAGDWDVSGVIVFSGTSATVTKAATDVALSAALSSYPASLQLGGNAWTSGTTGPIAVPTPTKRISLNAATAVMLVHQLYFGSGTVAVANAILRARRVR